MSTKLPVQLIDPTGTTPGQVPVSTGPNTAPQWESVSVLGGLLAANNLSDVANTATARGNLGAAATSGTLAQFAVTSSAQLAALLSDETGTGPNVFATGAVINPASTGLTTPGIGAFTTLSASGNDALLYTNTNGQSIASSTDTVVTTWTKTSDRLNVNFNAATGIFTAPVTGNYLVSGQITFATAANVVNTSFIAKIVSTSVFVSGIIFQSTTSSAATVVSIPATVVSMAAGNTLSIQVNQTTGSARVLSTSAGLNFLSIYRLP